MKLHYTQHALDRLAKRGLKLEWVERTVLLPDLVEPDPMDADLEHRLATIPELAGRVLRVIVSKTEPRRVVTAYPDRKMKGRL